MLNVRVWVARPIFICWLKVKRWKRFSTYPAESRPGTETIVSGTGRIEVACTVLGAVAASKHVRATVGNYIFESFGPDFPLDLSEGINRLKYIGGNRNGEADQSLSGQDLG